MLVTAYIGFGSNLGDLRENFLTAKSFLETEKAITLQRVSPLYLSEPLTLNGEDQPWYLNCVFEIQTSLLPHALLETLKNIEKCMGRKSRKRWSSRIIDLDVLLYDRLVYADDFIQIPHPEMTFRSFVMTPLADLIDRMPHPEFEMSIGELSAVCKQTLRLILWDKLQSERALLCS